MTKANTIKIFDGPSLIDGDRIILLVTGLSDPSANKKTGDMLQTWILRYDVAPHVAVKSGADRSICGGCPLRPSIFEKSVITPRSCYVEHGKAPRSTWKANRDLPVTDPDEVRSLIAGRKVRRGSYGDPGAVPLGIWEMLKNGKRSTGYTHQWESHPDLRTIAMASVHTMEERSRAMALGFRTFRVVESVEDLAPDEIICPASAEGGDRTTCANCGLCNGKQEFPDGRIDLRKCVGIVAHG